MPAASTATIRVRAPATSANLGPGFDCLGLAVDLWNEVTAVPNAPDDPKNLILRAARTVFDEVGAPFPGFALTSNSRIPFGRGLGSSAAAIAAGVLIANHCLGNPLDESACLRIATAIEGHPDNVVPCLLGGVRVATRTESGHVVQVPVPMRVHLRAVVFVPARRLSTYKARGVLPASVPFADALFNVARSSLLVAALAAGRTDVLREATRDRLHQPYRLSLFPESAELIAAAIEAGAVGAYTSGAGPTVLALCTTDAQLRAVAAGFERTAGEAGVPGSILRLALTRRGAHVVA